jgi:DNA-directed RNA polymerase specialized sigma24 family protein
MENRINSLDEVLQRYNNELTRYCKLIAGSSWDGEDLFQITLAKIYRARTTID